MSSSVSSAIFKNPYRNNADILPSVIIVGVFAVQLWAFFYIENIYALLGVVVALLAFSASPGSISHNHHHCPTFHHQWMNRWYEVLQFMETGVSPLAWTLHHNIGHHKEYLDPKKDTAPWINDDGSVMSRVKYDVWNSIMMYPEVCRMGRTRPKLYAKFKFWAVVSLALLSVFIYLDPVQALVLFVLPMPLMYLGLLDNTYMQHSDLDLSSDYTASRNTISKLYNLISWNLGYHTAHHMNPSLHWSKLPEFYAEIEKDIPEGVKCESLFLTVCSYRHSERGQSCMPVSKGDNSVARNSKNQSALAD